MSIDLRNLSAKELGALIAKAKSLLERPDGQVLGGRKVQESLRQLREPDAFPAGDVALMRALTDADGRRPDAVALLALAERWRPWRAYAAQHLWTDAGRTTG